MKTYLVTTGLLFGVIALVHVWRVIAEWPRAGISPGFALEMAVVIALPGALAWWAWRLLRKLPDDSTRRGTEEQPGKDAEDSGA
jgi:type VI protein secretion system component VasK